MLRIWGCFLKPFLNGWDVTPAQCICFTFPLFSIQLMYPEMDVHNAFVIGYLNSVMNPASVDRHHRSHHPSIDFSLRTPFPIILYQDSDCWFTWCSSTGLLKPHTLIVKSCIAPADISERSHLSLFDRCVLTLDCFSRLGLISAVFWPSWLLILCSCLSSDIPVTDHCLYDGVNSY